MTSSFFFQTNLFMEASFSSQVADFRCRPQILIIPHPRVREPLNLKSFNAALELISGLDDLTAEFHSSLAGSKNGANKTKGAGFP